ncbi:hypothetical protein EHV15_35480 [Paenibacillus oralis]|uniref:Uncharacterized protein n=1 Tax=Paenibacillus oralis TaxID=2490856 RepID=A0A3P3TCP8_9BACL|nr:hypothetical protein [Paenibacillus oralis]RRJ54878.1 hypothetical protein EHV15_35480 [Paenibacillus oralis]
MNNDSSVTDYIAIKSLMARILRQYYVSDNIIEKEELQNKYTSLLEMSKRFDEVSLTQQEKQLIEKIDEYSNLFEEYHLTDNIIRKAEIEDIFKKAILNNETPLKAQPGE